jgi:hypothetical protein
MKDFNSHFYEKYKDYSLEELLKVDSLAEAEEFTNTSYKENSLVTGLGLLIMGIVNDLKKIKAADGNDVTFGCDMEEYLPVVRSLGFELAFEEEVEFPYEYSESGIQREKIYIFAERTRGIVLVLQTFNMKSVNNATMYFQGRGTRVSGLSSSPGQIDRFPYEYTYSKDVREGLRSTIVGIDNLEGFEFISDWNSYCSGFGPKLLGYWDWKDYDIATEFKNPNSKPKVAHQRRMEQMPAWFIEQFGSNLSWD